MNTGGVPVASPSLLAVPFRRFRFACFPCVARRLSIPNDGRPTHCYARLTPSPRLPDTMDWAEATGRPAAWPT